MANTHVVTIQNLPEIVEGAQVGVEPKVMTVQVDANGSNAIEKAVDALNQAKKKAVGVINDGAKQYQVSVTEISSGIGARKTYSTSAVTEAVSRLVTDISVPNEEGNTKVPLSKVA